MARKLSNKCSELLIATQILPNLINTYGKCGLKPDLYTVQIAFTDGMKQKKAMNRRVTHTHELKLLQEEVPETLRLQRGALVPGESAEAAALANRGGEVAPAFPYFFLNPSSWLPSLTMAMGWDNIRTYAPRGLRYCFLALQTSNQGLRSPSYLSPFQAWSHPWSSISSSGEEEQAKTQGWEGRGKFGLDGRSEPLPWLSC